MSLKVSVIMILFSEFLTLCKYWPKYTRLNINKNSGLPESLVADFCQVSHFSNPLSIHAEWTKSHCCFEQWTLEEPGLSWLQQIWLFALQRPFSFVTLKSHPASWICVLQEDMWCLVCVKCVRQIRGWLRFVELNNLGKSIWPLKCFKWRQK